MATTVSGIIAVFLLAFYSYGIILLVRKPDQEPSPQVGTILGLVGGLVSALVVAVLSLTPPGQAVGFAVSAPDASLGGVKAATIVNVITWAYLFVWLICGAILVVVWARTPDPSKTLASTASSWLGLAAAAASVFLGLKTL